MASPIFARWQAAVSAMVTVLGLAWAMPAGAQGAPALPRFDIVCQYVDSPTTLEKIQRTWKWFGGAAVAAVDPTACPAASSDHEALVGPGDVVVVVGDADYAAALQQAGGKPLRLFLNGFDLGADGALVSVERRDAKAAMRFHAGSKKSTAQAFWSSVYQQQGILASGTLRAGVGWATDPAFTVPLDPKLALTVSVTSWLPLTLATLLGGVLVLFFWWALCNSDTFRVAPLYPWWLDARVLRAQVRKAAFPATPRARSAKDFDAARYAAQVTVPLKARYADFVWPAGGLDDYLQAAQQALHGRLPADAAALRKSVIGLALHGGYWKIPRLPYSLVRVQWGAWVMFSITAAIYLWLVYGEFPALAGSVLGLVTISTVTAGGSFIVDQAKGASLDYSRSFIEDLMTGNDGVQQAHRYQAIVVNVLLLVVGVMYVVQHLLYPTFDPSWLGLLAVSGAAQTLGKQVLEKPAP